MIITRKELEDAVLLIPYLAYPEKLLNELILNIESDKRERKIKRGMASLAKAEKNGNLNRSGRKKARDDHKISALRTDGFSYREIAKALNISHSSVYRSLKK